MEIFKKKQHQASKDHQYRFLTKISDLLLILLQGAQPERSNKKMHLSGLGQRVFKAKLTCQFNKV